MRTSIECYAKAVELDEKALLCPVGAYRDAYLNVAKGWRDTADLAVQREQILARFF